MHCDSFDAEVDDACGYLERMKCFSFQPGVEAGDVIIVLQEKEHDTFTRKGSDLFCTYNIGLTEALCGFEFTMKQLDGRDLVIKNAQGQVIQPGKCVLFNCFNATFL